MAPSPLPSVVQTLLADLVVSEPCPGRGPSVGQRIGLIEQAQQLLMPGRSLRLVKTN